MQSFSKVESSNGSGNGSHAETPVQSQTNITTEAVVMTRENHESESLQMSNREVEDPSTVKEASMQIETMES